MYKFVNLFCNIMIVLLAIYIIVTLIITNITYNSPIQDFDGDTIISFEELNNAQVIVEQYINVYLESDYQKFEKILDKSIKKSEDTYKKVKNNINNNEIFISDVKKGKNNNYLIKYTFSDNKEEYMLVHLNEESMTYIIYYDSMLAEY